MEICPKESDKSINQRKYPWLKEYYEEQKDIENPNRHIGSYELFLIVVFDTFIQEGQKLWSELIKVTPLSDIFEETEINSLISTDYCLGLLNQNSKLLENKNL